MARAAVDKWNALTPDHPRYVAGAIGPTQSHAVALARCQRSGLPCRHASTQVRESYETQVEGLLDGGVDLLLIETIFDTLNAKAAALAVRQCSIGAASRSR